MDLQDRLYQELQSIKFDFNVLHGESEARMNAGASGQHCWNDVLKSFSARKLL